MSNYDSILKDDKQEEIVEPVIVVEEKKKFKFPYFEVNFILIFVVLIISYIIYYYFILTPNSIFYNDINILLEKYLSLTKPLYIDNNSDLEGTIKLNEDTYEVLLLNNNRLDISNNERVFSYYQENNNSYLNVDNSRYYNITTKDKYLILSNLDSYLKKIDKSKFIKKVYINNKVPIVESNLVLDDIDIKNILGENILKNTYRVLFICRNNAISNKLISIKIIINDLTNNTRKVLRYSNNNLYYDNEEYLYRFELNGNINNFMFNIYQGDNIYWNFSGKREENTYKYLSKSVRESDEYSLIIEKEEANSKYSLNINNSDKILLELKAKEEDIYDIDISDSLTYEEASLEEKNRLDSYIEIIKDLEEKIKQLDIIKE